MPKKGFVYLIGAGPGDPGLITVKGKEYIGRADVILYDYLAGKELLSYARSDAELVYAGKVGGMHNREQRQINDLLVEKALAGNIVARLKGGDPFIFGRGGEECEALIAAGIGFEVVPGVTSGIAAAAYAGIPLTHRDFTTSVAFVTGHECEKESSDLDWERLSLGRGTVVFYMGMKNLPMITSNLISHGRPAETPVALIRWGTRPEQEVLAGTLADIAEKARRSSFRAPAIAVIGNVVKLREKLRWFDSRPLFGRSILVTRAADQAGEFSKLLTGLGAHVFECPTIRLVPPEDWQDLDRGAGNASGYDWVIFTSANAVRFFFQRLHHLNRDSRSLGNCKICAVGPKTAEALSVFGIRPDLIPADYKGEGVVEVFKTVETKGKRILFPKADKAREVIPEGLASLGMLVDAPVAYRNVIPERLPEEALQALEDRRVDCVTFTSSSTVENLAGILGENRFLHLLQGVKVASIGPITSKTCLELGLEVHMEPKDYTIAALADEITSFFKNPSRPQ